MTLSAQPVHRQNRFESRFFLIYSIFLLGIVIVAFAPSFYLSTVFDAQAIPLYIHFHGAILTGWFVILVVQAWHINSHNQALHRKIGPFAAAYGILVVVGALMATFNVVSRGLGNGITLDTDMAIIDPALGSGISYLAFISGVVWANMASVFAFTIFLAAAVIYRNQSDIHKRLLFVATISILGPALARISRLEIFGGEQGPFIPLSLLALFAIILIYDLFSLRKIHAASLIAISLAIAIFMLGVKLAETNYGLGFVRGLA